MKEIKAFYESLCALHARSNSAKPMPQCLTFEQVDRLKDGSSNGAPFCKSPQKIATELAFLQSFRQYAADDVIVVRSVSKGNVYIDTPCVRGGAGGPFWVSHFGKPGALESKGSTLESFGIFPMVEVDGDSVYAEIEWAPEGCAVSLPLRFPLRRSSGIDAAGFQSMARSGDMDWSYVLGLPPVSGYTSYPDVRSHVGKDKIDWIQRNEFTDKQGNRRLKAIVALEDGRKFSALISADTRALFNPAYDTVGLIDGVAWARVDGGLVLGSDVRWRDIVGLGWDLLRIERAEKLQRIGKNGQQFWVFKALCREPESNEVFEYSGPISGSDPIAAALGPLSPEQLAKVAKGTPAIVHPQRGECKLPESLLGPEIDFGI